MIDETDGASVSTVGAISPSPTEQVDHYALQQSAKTAMRTFALKRDDTFLVADVRGDLLAAQQEMGLFWRDTRYLRTLDLLLEGQPLISLAHSIADEGDVCQVDLCNPFLQLADGTALPQGTIHIRRWLEVHEHHLVEHLSLTSYHQHPLTVRLGTQANADFRDIFEVRGMQRAHRGQMLPPQLGRDALTLRYQGLDEVLRTTHVALSPPADEVSPHGIYWNVALRPNEAEQMQINVELSENLPTSAAIDEGSDGATPLALPEVATSNVFFNRLLSRSLYDLTMMSARTPDGIFPYAGLPWYVCPFGRDSLITSLEFLPWYPQIARGTLLTLAKHQGTKIDEFTEEEPGKILHEFRRGEMAHCMEVPFIPYYGTIDATPLFIILLEAYVRWTNDTALLRELWPHAEAAANWMTQYGDRDGDGFLEYARNTEKGLINQGWKDSLDAISHANGELAEAPIALCEVQGYAYAAYLAMDTLAQRLGQPKSVGRGWRERAERLRSDFWRAFWWEEEQTLYLALDGAKRPCEVVSSNAGQCLWSGIVPPEAAGQIVARLMRDDMYSEWGIRTLSSHAVRYNPMSYHNGSVWPHDTALIGAGFARYGYQREAGKLLEDLFTLSLHYERARLPELLCGFARRQGYGPTPYPVACSPQAWAAGAPFLLLSALLGLQPHANEHQLTAYHPYLPGFLHEIETMTLMLGDQPIEITATRGKRGAVTVTHQGKADLLVVAGA